MGVYLGNRWVRLRFSKRGLRYGVGPRIFRRWGGRGGRGTSTGIGPFGAYRRDRHQPPRR